MTSTFACDLAHILSLLLEKSIQPEDSVAMGEGLWDSLKQIEIIMTVEEHFHISFLPQEIPQLTSQKKLLARILELKAHG